MSQQFPGSFFGRDSNTRSHHNNYSASGTGLNGRDQFGEYLFAPLPQHTGQTDGNPHLVQPGYDAGRQCPYQINDWHNAAFDANQLGGSPFSSASYDVSSNLPNEGFDVGLDFQLTPTWASDNIYGYNQPIVPTMHRSQPIPAFYPTPTPATNAGPIRCPKGCSKTFGRSEELRSHMKKHETPRYKCPIYDCPMTFYRKDKLRDHTQKGHKGRNSLNIR